MNRSRYLSILLLASGDGAYESKRPIVPTAKNGLRRAALIVLAAVYYYPLAESKEGGVYGKI